MVCCCLAWLVEPHWAGNDSTSSKQVVALLALAAELLYIISILAELELEPAEDISPMPHSQLHD